MIVAELKNISLKINDHFILRDINFSLQKGKIATLIGPNGGGKTSIARILLGIANASSGEVKLRQNLKIGYMPQKIEIDKTIPMRVVDFLKLSSNKIDNKQLENSIKKFDLAKILNNQIGDISGGWLQKVLFVKAILSDPDLLVLDEPTQYMDIAAIAEFYRAIEEIRNENNCAILLISHDLHMVMQKTDFVFCVNNHICCHGVPELVNEHPQYLSLFQNKDSNIAIYHHNHDHKH